MKQWLITILIGRDVVKLVSDYFRFKQACSDEGKNISAAERTHLLSLSIRIAEKLVAKIIGSDGGKKNFKRN